jgi:hypothetical protein
VVADPGYADLPRDLDVVELWSGVQSIVNAAIKMSLNAKPYDILREPGKTEFSEDITSLPALV